MIKRINKLSVSLHLEDLVLEVGELVLDNRKLYFKYHSDFIQTALEISPFQMKLSNEILVPNTAIFDGLFGVFNDSLPDGWGRLLLDRSLIAKGIAVQEISILDRLAYVGHSGMGALVYTPKIEIEGATNKDIILETIETEAEHILKGEVSEILDDLYYLGGSSGGARPKIFVGYNPKTEHLIYDTDRLPDDYEHWIIKFPSSFDLPDSANIEYAYYKMALDAGITMSESKLFTTASGKYYFGTKRFDRIGNKRLHMHSVSGLLHDNFRYSNLDYGHIMNCAFSLENHVEAYLNILRLAAFNVYSHNRDDHSKNISFLMSVKGDWKLAPAYDLTFSSSSHGMHSTTIAGEGRSPGRKQLLELAETFSLKNPEAIIDQVLEVVNRWGAYALQSHVSSQSMTLISKTLKSIVA